MIWIFRLIALGMVAYSLYTLVIWIQEMSIYETAPGVITSINDPDPYQVKFRTKEGTWITTKLHEELESSSNGSNSAYPIIQRRVNDKLLISYNPSSPADTAFDDGYKSNLGFIAEKLISILLGPFFLWMSTRSNEVSWQISFPLGPFNISLGNGDDNAWDAFDTWKNKF